MRRGIVSRVTAGLIKGHHNDTSKPRGVDVPASIEYENVGFCFFGGTLELWKFTQRSKLGQRVVLAFPLTILFDLLTPPGSKPLK